MQFVAAVVAAALDHIFQSGIPCEIVNAAFSSLELSEMGSQCVIALIPKRVILPKHVLCTKGKRGTFSKVQISVSVMMKRLPSGSTTFLGKGRNSKISCRGRRSKAMN